jgi:hypothetical protein
MGCARCHDHKFEPIFHKDYYALYGIFASSHYPYAGSELSKSASVLMPLDLSIDASALDIWNREVVAAAAAFPKTKPRTVLASSGSAWGFEEMERSEAIETRMPGSPEQIHLKIYGTPPPARTLALLRARLDSLTQPAAKTARKDALAVVAQSLLTSNTFLYLR